MKSARLDRSSFPLSHGKENTMGLRIESHGFGSRLSGEFVDCTVMVRRILVEKIDCAIAVREENQMGRGLIDNGINTLTDRHRRDHCSRVCVKHRHLLIPAADEESSSGEVHGQSGWRLTGV